MALVPTTLQSLLTVLRQRTNMEVNQFVTDLELTNYLNASLSLLDGILVSKFSDYKLTKVLATVQPNTNIITLPLDFLKLRGVDLWLANGQSDGYLTMNEYGWDERNKKVYPFGGNLILSPYRLEGNQITILPPQTAANYTYRLNYTPDYIPLVLVTDTLQTYMDTQSWSQYAIYDSAAQILAKQDQDISFFMAQAGALRDHLIKMATPNRNAAEPKSVGVSSRGDGGAGSGYGWGW